MGGGRRGKWMMDIKEGTCWEEHWVLYVSDESLGSTPEAKTTLHVDSLEIKLKKKNRFSIFV